MRRSVLPDRFFGVHVGGHEHEVTDLDLEGLGVVFRDGLLDSIDGFLQGALAPLGGDVDGNFGMVDVANQLPEGAAGHAPEEIEDGKFNGGQRQAERDAVVAKVESIDVDLLQEEVQVAGILAQEKRLQVVQEDRVEPIDVAVRDGNALGAVGRPDATEIAVLPAKKLDALDDDGG